MTMSVVATCHARKHIPSSLQVDDDFTGCTNLGSAECNGGQRSVRRAVERNEEGFHVRGSGGVWHPKGDDNM